MPGVARIVMDAAGGPIIGGGNFKVFADGSPVAVIGDAVTGHAPGPHAAPVMVRASTRVFASGKPVCRMGDSASCGDVVTGSSRVIAS